MKNQYKSSIIKNHKITEKKKVFDGIPLTHSLIHHFETVPNSMKLQTTTEMWLLKDFKKKIHRKHCGKR